MGRLFRWVIGLLVVSSIAELIAAYLVKQRTPSVGDRRGRRDRPGRDLRAAQVREHGRRVPRRHRPALVRRRRDRPARGDARPRRGTADRQGADRRRPDRRPDDWQVDLQVTSILGGAGDARPAMGRLRRCAATGRSTASSPSAGSGSTSLDDGARDRRLARAESLAHPAVAAAPRRQQR